MNDVMEDDDADLIRWFSRQSPAAVETWLQDHQVPDDFDWRGLAAIAVNRALPVDNDNQAVGLAWGRVWVLAHERLAALAADARGHRNHIRDAMYARAELINRYGVAPGDPLRDCDQVIEWFLTGHADEYDAVASDSGRWMELPVERIRHLRDIKNELKMFALLGQCPAYSNPEVQRWIALWDRLP